MEKIQEKSGLVFYEKGPALSEMRSFFALRENKNQSIDRRVTSLHGLSVFCTGQAMLITVLSLGGAILGATALAGFLIVYQIRSATDFADSAKAVFAADAGTEWALDSYFNPNDPPAPTSSLPFSNGASIAVVECNDGSGVQYPFGPSPADCNDSNPKISLSSGYAHVVGAAAGTRRAFREMFNAPQ